MPDENAGNGYMQGTVIAEESSIPHAAGGVPSQKTSWRLRFSSSQILSDIARLRISLRAS